MVARDRDRRTRRRGTGPRHGCARRGRRVGGWSGRAPSRPASPRAADRRCGPRRVGSDRVRAASRGHGGHGTRGPRARRWCARSRRDPHRPACSPGRRTARGAALVGAGASRGRRRSRGGSTVAERDRRRSGGRRARGPGVIAPGAPLGDRRGAGTVGASSVLSVGDRSGSGRLPRDHRGGRLPFRHVLVGTGAGRFCVVLGLGLEVLGAMWMRAIVRAGDAP